MIMRKFTSALVLLGSLLGSFLDPAAASKANVKHCKSGGGGKTQVWKM